MLFHIFYLEFALYQTNYLVRCKSIIAEMKSYSWSRKVIFHVNAHRGLTSMPTSSIASYIRSFISSFVEYLLQLVVFMYDHVLFEWQVRSIYPMLRILTELKNIVVLESCLFLLIKQFTIWFHALYLKQRWQNQLIRKFIH